MRLWACAPVGLWVYGPWVQFGMAAGMEGARRTGQVRPDHRVIDGHCESVVLLARAVVRDLMTSLCVQVPRDTEMCPETSEFHLARIISAEHSAIVHMMYLRRCSTLNATLFGHHRCESLDFRDLARARTGQPRGLGN